MGLEWPLVAKCGTKIDLKSPFQGSVGMKSLGVLSTKVMVCNQTKYQWQKQKLSEGQLDGKQRAKQSRGSEGESEEII